MKRSLTIISCAFFIFNSNAQNHLALCWQKQVKAIQKKHIVFSYKEERNELEHSFQPWQQTQYISNGTVWNNAHDFKKQDTLLIGKRSYYSKIDFTPATLLFLDYGDQALFGVTKAMFLDQMFKTARYTPINIINYFFEHKIPISHDSNPEFAIYETTINQSIVKLYIRKKNHLLEKITTLNDDALFGDVLTNIHYSSFTQIRKLSFPKTISITKINGEIQDKVSISNVKFSETIPSLLKKRDDYVLKPTEKTQAEIKIDAFKKNIYFLELKHTDDRVMIVEFSDFLLIAEAPLNSENGDLIIKEAKKIAPNKPIKYFVFGHYHPHYLGGIRPFIHEGAKVICSDYNKEYVKYIANAPHTINPDLLQTEPKPLQIKLIKDSLSISDGNFEMEIYLIGEKSAHTIDYLIYYFPNEKLLFQDDLIWIKKTGKIEKAGKRQAGLYHAIMALDLDIETIVQSWPVADYGVKTIITFKELASSIKKE